jgi:hypothetical protein
MTAPIPVDVEVDRTRTDRRLPHAFHWQGKRVLIRSWGRAWDDEDGYHVLVMAESGRVFELLHLPERDTWELIDPPTMFPPRSAV